MSIRGDAARRYHDATKHTYESVRRGAGGLDFANFPHPFKEYGGLEPIPLPGAGGGETPTLRVLAAPAGDPEEVPTLATLAHVLRLGTGVVRTALLVDGRTIHFRTYSSAGALYPIEVYVACGHLSGLDAGLYHFHPGELALRRLRETDVRAHLAAAAAAPELARAGAVLVLTGILWRTAWKYGARGYRHLFWDAGTMLANLLALAVDERLGPRLVTGFVDADVNRLVGVDGVGEAALALLALGRGEEAPPPPGEVEPLELEVTPLSLVERRYPEAEAAHAATSLASAGEVGRYRAARPRAGAEPSLWLRATTSAPASELESLPLARTLRRRGSTRAFAREPVARDALAAVLARAAAPIPADVPPWTAIATIANAIEDLEPGVHRFVPPAGFEPVRAGNLRGLAGYLVLEQELGMRAAATSFVLADLDAVLATHGDRGYRAAQLEAGVRVGRVYLAATSLGWGATASTFYDDDVSRELQTGEAPMLAVAVGRPTRTRRSSAAARSARTSA